MQWPVMVMRRRRAISTFTGERIMPERSTIKRARRDKRQGKSPSTQAGEFVREEFHHVREGKHGARSPEQIIAIGLSKARRSGVKLPPPKKGRTSERTRRSAETAYETGQGQRKPRRSSRRRSRAISGVMKRERRSSASPSEISRQAKQAARRRSSSERSAAARQASRTKGPARRRAAARKAAKTRARHGR